MFNSQTGLTLVELLVTLAVAIVLIAVGMPLFTGVAGNNRAVSQANTFVTGFKLARSEAVRRSTEVSVCALATAGSTACGNAANWGNGFMVFTDRGTAGSVDGADDEIRVFQIPKAGPNVTATTAYIRFLPEGDVEAASLTGNTACPGSGTCLELGHSDATGVQTRCLHVMGSGQVRLSRGACS